MTTVADILLHLFLWIAIAIVCLLYCYSSHLEQMINAHLVMYIFQGRHTSGLVWSGLV